MKKVLVVFGGQSPEHEVSIMSGLCVSNNIDNKKFNIEMCYIDKKGEWNVYSGNRNLNFGQELQDLKKIDNIIDYLKGFDVIFPVLHGENGEDGNVQGLFEYARVKYVGSKVLGSALAMDKAYAKIIFGKAGIRQTKHLYIKKCNEGYVYVDNNLNEEKCSLEDILLLAVDKLSFPMFIKPSNSGSSLGISKADTKEELEKAIKEAEKYDYKILIEQGVKARELECAVLGNDHVIASKVGEIISADSFYDFDSKYKNSESKTIVNPDLDDNIEKNIQNLAIKSFKALDCKGLARVDFFLDENDNIYLNEINTMPGFTSISMYPKLFEASGVNLKDLLTKIIELALT